ncbi:MAG TPA: ABC-2 family transporter protein [Kofleriaceae bacterium]|jgi:ABC-2 type transport system permease protein
MRRYLEILGVQLRLSASAGMAYRSDFIIEGVMAIAWMALTLLPLGVLFNDRDTVAGYTAPEALIVVGYFMGVRGVLEGVVSPSFVDLVERIRSGSFDYVLLKPVDAQVMISASRFEPWKIFDVLGALGIVIYGLVKRGIMPTPGDIALGIALFFAGVLAMYALWMVCAAASFWVVKLDNLVFLLGAIFDTARWPVQIFPTLWRFVFTFVLPLALMTTYPAMALMGRLDGRAVLAVIAGAIVLLGLGRVVWRTAIRSYTSASS